MIHLVKMEQETCFLSLIDLLQRPAWKREQVTWSLLDTALFLSSLCQIHISPEPERGPKEFLKLLNSLKHFPIPYSKARSATDCYVISDRCQRLLTFSEDSSDGVLSIFAIYPFICFTILINFTTGIKTKLFLIINHCLGGI